MAGEKARKERKESKRFVLVDTEPLATKLCPFCEGKLDKPLGVGIVADDVIGHALQLGLRFSEPMLKRWVKMGLLPRPVSRRASQMRKGKPTGRPTSIGVYPKSVIARLKLIAKLKAKSRKEADIIAYFERKGYLFI